MNSTSEEGKQKENAEIQQLKEFVPTRDALQQLTNAEELADQLENRLDTFLGDLSTLLSTMTPDQTKSHSSTTQNNLKKINDK